MFDYAPIVDNSAQHYNDFMNLINMASQAEDSEGRSFYTPGYGGYGTSELRHNMYQNFFTNFSNYMIQREVNDTNLQLAQDENRFNEYMWNENNKYNSPIEQAKRFQDAGMSTAGAVQATQGFPSQQVQSANLANQQIGNSMQAAPFGNPFSALMNVLDFAGSMLNLHRGMEALRMDRVNAEKAEKTLDADIDSIITKKDAQHWALAQQIQDFQYNSETFGSRVSAQKYFAQKAEKDVHYQDYANQLAAEKVKLAQQEFGFLDKYHSEQFREIQSIINKNIAEQNKAEQEARESKAREGLANEQADYYNALEGNVQKDTQFKEEQITGEKRKNYALAVQNALNTFGMPEDFTGKMAAMVEGGILSPEEVGSFLDHDKEFLRTAGEKFDGTESERNAFNYFLAPANGRSNNVPLWSHGTYNVTRGKVVNAGKTIIGKLNNKGKQSAPFSFR